MQDVPVWVVPRQLEQLHRVPAGPQVRREQQDQVCRWQVRRCEQLYVVQYMYRWAVSDGRGQARVCRVCCREEGQRVRPDCGIVLRGLCGGQVLGQGQHIVHELRCWPGSAYKR